MAAFVPVATGRSRPFQIIGTLRQGDGDRAPDLDFALVAAAHRRWQEERDLILGILISPLETSYAWREPGAAFVHQAEPGWRIHGTANVKYDDHLNDQEFRARVLDLADYLGTALNQARLYITVCGEDIILQEVGKTTPAGE